MAVKFLEYDGAPFKVESLKVFAISANGPDRELTNSDRSSKIMWDGSRISEEKAGAMAAAALSTP